jgi:hypothetical protein
VDILEIARHSGMQVILNGRIGREEYQSVYGSVQALQRFADALLNAARKGTSHSDGSVMTSPKRSSHS